jgi:pimeloyl-ACP methyl ester carboxylesterase
VLSASRFVPGFSLSAFGTGAWLARFARPTLRASMVATAGPPDRELFETAAGEYLVTDACEALRQGGRGPARDLPLVGNDWGFSPRVDPPVTLVHGEADVTVGVETARAFADRLDCALHVGEGAHYSTMVDEQTALLTAALGETAARATGEPNC